MIFILTDLIKGKDIVLSERKEYIVGRKNCDILIENDPSISRNHAVLRVNEDHVTLIDSGSKYHTMHKGVEIAPHVEIQLEKQDEIQFGAVNSKFRFESYNFMTTTTGLSSAKKGALKKDLNDCGGKFVDKWTNNCTHLTVAKIILTIKLLQALVDEKPIVTPEYWTEYAKSIKYQCSPPDINKHNKPPIAEVLLRSDFEYKVDPKRKTLFKDKIFVFLQSKMKNEMEDIICSCGGECIAWDKTPLTFYEISKSPKEHLFIKVESDENNGSFNSVINEFTKRQKRAIPLNEIALAIVHCSCNKNCNPSFNKVNVVFGANTQNEPSLGTPLVMDTQTEQMDGPSAAVKTEQIIPASVDDDLDNFIPNAKDNQESNTNGMKRLNTEAENYLVLLKKPKLEEEQNKNRAKEKLERVEDMPTKTTDDKEMPATNTTEKNSTKNTFQLSLKRKTNENSGEDNMSKKIKVNPFSLIKPTSSKTQKTDDNPFELTKRTNKTLSLSLKNPPQIMENPFARPTSSANNDANGKVIEGDNKHSSFKAPTKQIQLVKIKRDVSSISTTKKSVLYLNSTWMSKENSFKNTSIKIEDEDPELAKISKAFRDCVKVEVLPENFIKKYGCLKNGVNNTNNTVNGIQNFKKFKKVAPVKPQVKVIGRDQFTKVGPGNTACIIISDLNMSDDEDVPDTKQKGRPKAKRFIL